MARQTLPVKAGDVIAYPVTFREEGGDFVDLTGSAWLAQVRVPLTGELRATFGLTPQPNQAGSGKGKGTLTATAIESAKVRNGDYLDVEDTSTGFTWLEFVLEVSTDAAYA